MYKKVCIVCPEHGEFYQLPYVHMRGSGCKECGCDKNSAEFMKSHEQFLLDCFKVHGELYDYDDSVYDGAHKKVDIRCRKHGIFSQTPNTHINLGSGCPNCVNTTYSKVQIEWIKTVMDYLKINIQHAENDKEYLISNSKFRADGFHLETNTVFEFNGCFYHGCTLCDQFKPDSINARINKTYKELNEKTISKMNHIIENGYNYIELWECQWKELKKDPKKLELYLEDLKNKLANL